MNKKDLDYKGLLTKELNIALKQGGVVNLSAPTTLETKWMSIIYAVRMFAFPVLTGCHIHHSQTLNVVWSSQPTQTMNKEVVYACLLLSLN